MGAEMMQKQVKRCVFGVSGGKRCRYMEAVRAGVFRVVSVYDGICVESAKKCVSICGSGAAVEVPHPIAVKYGYKQCAEPHARAYYKWGLTGAEMSKK